MRRSKIHPTLGYREGCGGYDWMMSGVAESKLNPMIDAGLCEMSGVIFQGSESVKPIHANECRLYGASQWVHYPPENSQQLEK